MNQLRMKLEYGVCALSAMLDFPFGPAVDTALNISGIWKGTASDVAIAV